MWCALNMFVPSVITAWLRYWYGLSFFLKQLREAACWRSGDETYVFGNLAFLWLFHGCPPLGPTCHSLYQRSEGAILSTDLPEQQGQHPSLVSLFLPFCHRSSLTQSPCAPLPGQINAYLMPSPARPTTLPWPLPPLLRPHGGRAWADRACTSLEAALLLPPPWRGSHLRRVEGHGRSGGRRLSGSGGRCSEEPDPWPEKAARPVL